MTLHVEITEHPDFVEAVASGTLEMRDAIERFSAILAACSENGIAKALIDYRDLEGVVTPAEETEYARRVREQHHMHVAFGERGLTLAYVGSPLAAVGTGGLGLKLAEEWNIRAAVFTRREDALEWLGVGRVPEAQAGE